MKYSRIVPKCCKENAKIAKEKIRKDDEEEITLQKLLKSKKLKLF